MAKYINADKLFVNLDMLGNPDSEFVTDDYIDGFSDGISAVMKEIKTTDTVDIISIVRCKECIYFQAKNSLGTQGICVCGEKEMNDSGEFYPMQDDFCSYGVSKL